MNGVGQALQTVNQMHTRILQIVNIRSELARVFQRTDCIRAKRGHSLINGHCRGLQNLSCFGLAWHGWPAFNAIKGKLL